MGGEVDLKLVCFDFVPSPSVDMKTIKIGEFRVITRFEDPPVLLEVTYITNERFWFVKGICVLTGKEWVHGLYNDAQWDRVGPPLNEMEVLAWVSR